MKYGLVWDAHQWKKDTRHFRMLSFIRSEVGPNGSILSYLVEFVMFVVAGVWTLPSIPFIALNSVRVIRNSQEVPTSQ